MARDAFSRVAADIGGTFTDVVSVDEGGALRIGKSLTTHGAEHDGVMAALASAQIDLSASRTLFAHGHTLVINSLLERNGARVGLVTTRGFADVVEMGRGSRPEIFNFKYRRDPPLVPRTLRFEVSERIYASGEIALRPSEDELDALAEKLRQAKVEAVAVALLNSYVDPTNERYVGEHLRRALPGVHLTLSSDLSRQWREFERFTTATANAYVAPKASGYVQRLLTSLQARGFTGEFILLNSSGGAVALDGATRFPIRTVESGPVAGVIGARELAGHLSVANLVTLDMGGTTTKSCLIEDGQFASTELYWIGGYDRGFPIQVRSVDITEVGAGGGSIAWMDESGRLRIGPRSAGSRPGPASYGLGGTEPTVTDANLYCGRIDSEHFVGSLKLDSGAAADAIGRLATTLNLDGRRLALGILTLTNLSMTAAVRRQTLERGRDPRDFTLVAYGGAGPMHACEVAADVGIPQVVIPLFPGHFSAIGMLGADLRLDRREIIRGSLESLDAGAVRDILERTTAELTTELAAANGASGETPLFSYSLGLRYGGQQHTLLIPAPEQAITVPDNLAAVFEARFQEEYLRRYGHLDDQAEIEVVELEVVAVRPLPSVRLTDARPSLGESSQIQSHFAPSGEAVTTDVLPRGDLAEGDTFSGPLVVYEDGATTVVPPRARGIVGAGGLLVIDVRALR